MQLHEIAKKVQEVDCAEQYAFYDQIIPFAATSDERDFYVSHFAKNSRDMHLCTEEMAQIVKQNINAAGKDANFIELAMKTINEALDLAQERGINDNNIAKLESEPEAFCLMVHGIKIWRYRSLSLFDIMNHICEDIRKAAAFNYAQRPSEEEVAKVSELLEKQIRRKKENDNNRGILNELLSSLETQASNKNVAVAPKPKRPPVVVVEKAELLQALCKHFLYATA